MTTTTTTKVRWLAVTLGLILATLLAALAPAQSWAAAGRGAVYHGFRIDNYVLGNYQMEDGTITWCAFDPNLYSPSNIDAQWGDYQMADPNGFTAGGTSQGVVISGDAYARIAYLLGKYGATDDDATAAAVYRIMHTEAFTGVATTPRSWQMLESVAGLADQLWNEAGQFSGPYTLANPELAAEGTPAQTLSAKLHPVVAASGQELPDTTVTATINGPATWENGSKDLQYQGERTERIIATGNGPVTVNLSAAVPGTTFKFAVSDTPKTQRIFLAGDRSTVNAGAALPVIGQFAPQATSTAETFDAQTSATPVQDPAGNVTSVDYPHVGSTLTDVLHVTTTADAPWLNARETGKPVPATFVVDWYYSPVALPKSADIPEQVQKFDSSSAVVTAPGDVAVKSTKPIDQPGYYYPVVSFDAAAQQDQARSYFLPSSSFTAAFHDDREETLSPWTPKVSTQTAGVADGKITDTLKVDGNEPETELTVKSTLYATEHSAVDGGLAAAPDDAVALGTVTTLVTGNATVTTDPLDVSSWLASADSDGKTLYWAETVERTPVTEGWTGRHLLPSETWVKPVTPVTEQPQAAPASLAHTGTGEWAPMAAAAVALLGGVIVAAARVRRRRAALQEAASK